jgi:ABC-type amino acid transport substrate-binding protein
LKNPAELNKQIIEQYYQKVLKLDLKLGGIVYVDSLSDGLLMLRNRKVDALHVMRFTGRYLAQRSHDLKMYTNQQGTYSTQMIFSPKKESQYNKVNSALQDMKKDGTFDKLIKQWITDLPVGQEPAGKTIPVIQGAETIKVGISGDEPPLDYIAAGGAPGGFNIAVLNEISRRTNINIELVTVVSGARFACLQSGKIDSFLWHNALMAMQGLPEEVISPEKSDGPDEMLKTVSYLDDKSSLMVLR